MTEWKLLEAYPGYEVSDRGRVRGPRGELRRTLDKDGYPVVSLFTAGKKVQRFVHALVLHAFVGPRPPGKQARHFPDRDRANNAVENLLWGTAKENTADKYVHGTMEATLAAGRRGAANHPRGERHPLAKLREGEVRVVQMLHALPRSQRPSQEAIGRVFGVGQHGISQIWRGRNWSHVKA